MGLVWLLLGLPLLAFVLQLARRRSALIWTFLVPLGAVRAAAISLVEPVHDRPARSGLVALVVVLETIPSRLLRVTIQSLTLVLVAIAVWFSSGRVIQWGHVYSLSETVSLAGRSRASGLWAGSSCPASDGSTTSSPTPGLPSPSPCTSTPSSADCPDLPFFYGLYGRHFQHRVFRLRGSTRDSMLAWLRRHDIGYVHVSRRTRYARWLAGEAGVPAPVQGLAGRGLCHRPLTAGSRPRNSAPGTRTSAYGTSSSRAPPAPLRTGG